MLRLPQKLTLQHHHIMRLPREVTLQHDQILRLPRKVTPQQFMRSQATKNCGHKRPKIAVTSDPAPPIASSLHSFTLDFWSASLLKFALSPGRTSGINHGRPCQITFPLLLDFTHLLPIAVHLIPSHLSKYLPGLESTCTERMLSK